jgi:DNA-binding MarR family transcriptional regulator
MAKTRTNPKRTGAPITVSVLEDLPFYLARLQASFRRLRDRTLREEGLPPQPTGMGSVLYSLLEQDDCLVKHLIDRTHLPNGTVTYILDCLEKQGLVERTTDARDGRARRIRLTGKGRSVHAKLLRRHERVMAVFRSALSPEEMETLKQLLARVTAALQSDSTR